MIVNSLEWVSASADLNFPWGEIGVHVHAHLTASDVLARLDGPPQVIT